jgi:hypothetical protein
MGGERRYQDGAHPHFSLSDVELGLGWIRRRGAEDYVGVSRWHSLIVLCWM